MVVSQLSDGFGKLYSFLPPGAVFFAFGLFQQLFTEFVYFVSLPPIPTGFESGRNVVLIYGVVPGGVSPQSIFVPERGASFRPRRQGFGEPHRYGAIGVTVSAPPSIDFHGWKSSKLVTG
jgi:hypothetical protein